MAARNGTKDKIKAVMKAGRLALNWTRHGATCEGYSYEHDQDGNQIFKPENCSCGILALKKSLDAMPEGFDAEGFKWFSR